jgi:CRISPR system Cascade subunit CasD
LDRLKQAVQQPHYTPYLGRRSCPLTRPLYFNDLEAEHALAALALCEPKTGIIYTEEQHPLFDSKPKLLIRDVPIALRKRQFATRTVRILAGESYVPE